MSHANGQFVVLESVQVPRQPQWLGLMDGALLRLGDEGRFQDQVFSTTPIIGLPGAEVRVGLGAANIAISPAQRFIAWSSGVVLCVLGLNDGAVNEVVLPQDGEESVYNTLDWAREEMVWPLTGSGFAVHGVVCCDAARIAVECAGPSGHRVQLYKLNSEGIPVLHETMQMEKGASGVTLIRGTTTVQLGTAMERPLMADSLTGELIVQIKDNNYVIRWTNTKSGDIVRECCFPKSHSWYELTVMAFDGERFAAASLSGDVIIWDGQQWSFHHLGANFGTYRLAGMEMPTPNSHVVHALEWTVEGRLRIAVSRVERNPDNAYSVSCVYANGTWHAELLELRL